MDLEPYDRIPLWLCWPETVDLFTIGIQAAYDDVAEVLGQQLCALLPA